MNVTAKLHQHDKGDYPESSLLIEITDQIFLFGNKANNEAHFCDKLSIWEQNMILLFLCSAAGWHIKEDFETTRQWIYPPDPGSITVF